MELLPLGGNSASPQPPTQPETSATPAPAAVPQTPPYAAPSAAPIQEANPWRSAAPAAPQPASSYDAPRNEKSSSGAPTLGAIALVVLSLGAGVLRAYNRQQLREERRMEETRQQHGYNENAEAVRQQSAAIRAANAERNNYNQSARPYFPPPNPTRVGFPPPSDKGGNDPLAPPSPRMRALLLNEAGRAGNGRTVARSVISATGNGVYYATVTYNTGEAAQFVYDGSVWTREGGGELPAAVGTQPMSSGPAGQMAGQPNQQNQLGQQGQPGQVYSGGNGYSQPGNSAAPGSGGSAFGGAGSGIANPASGAASGSGANAPNGYGAPGTVPPGPVGNPDLGGGNSGEANPPPANPNPGAPPAGG